MKANKKTRLKDNNKGYVRVVGTIVAFLLMVIVAVLIYWETQGSIDQFGEVVETFTGYTYTDNGTAWSVELDNSPIGTSDTNVTCCNVTTGDESYPAFTLHHRTIGVAADAADYFTQVNVTYTSNMANSEDSTSDMASTIFDLLPIIALAVVAVIIIGVIMGLGSGKKGGL